jgi:peptidoglycan-N-acetylglucosamine deacetylase
VIVRRLVITLALALFVSLTVGVILGLDESARRDLADRLPGGADVASPSAQPTPTATKAKASPTSKPTSPTSTPSTKTTAKPSPSPSASGKKKPSTSSKVMKAKIDENEESESPPSKDGRTVYLTFDDGPGPYTWQVLQILRDTGSTATFFQLGINAQGQDEINDAIRAQGSNIANHSYSHPNLTTLSPAKLRYQIANGPKSKCFRPPYGATNATVRKAISAAGARQVLWTVDTLDWQKPGVGALEYYGKSRLVQDGGIILMHDGGGEREQTVAALPQMIKSLKARGFAVRALPYC